MIVVAGEALIDLVVAPEGLTASAGGAPYNVARACGRLGTPTALAASLSDDGFGRTLRAGLVECGVSDDLLQFTQRPTTLAVAQVDGDGVATYHFYTEETSAPQLTPGPVPDEALALVTGGLALVLEPMASAVERLVTEVRAGVLVVIDINARPGAIADRDPYVERIRVVTARADVVKASHEDLEYLFPGESIQSAAAHVLDGGAKAVLVTSGPGDTTIVTPAGALDVPVVPVEVVDTIGAGDAFTAGFTTHWLTSNASLGELREPPVLLPSVQAGHAVAAVVVGRRGADPPTRNDVDWPT